MRSVGSGASYVGIDAARAIAALVVLFVHARVATFVPFGELSVDSKTLFVAIFFGLTRLGREAVLVFFALSGFLVAGRVLELLKNGSFNLVVYFIDRATRILIPLVAACIFTVLVIVWIDRSLPSLLQVAGNMVGLNGVFVETLKFNPPLWSIAYEIWFYVVLGGVAALLSGLRLGIYVTVLGLLVFVTLGSTYLAVWILAGVVYLARLQLARVDICIVGTCLVLIGSIAAQFAGKTFPIAGIRISWGEGLADPVICMGAALLLPILATETCNQALLRWRKLCRELSELSYSLYLTHMPLLALIATFWPKHSSVTFVSLIQFATSSLLCLLFAWAFCRVFERGSYIVRSWLKSLWSDIGAAKFVRLSPVVPYLPEPSRSERIK